MAPRLHPIRGLLVVLAWALGCPLPPSSADPAAWDDPPRVCEGRPDRSGRRGPRPEKGRLAHRELDAIFRPAPEDFGPLMPGEEAELRKFVRQHWPRLYRFLNELESRRPEVYRQKMKRLVPRLRHLRRLQEENPDLAKLVGRYGENLFQIELLRRAWQHGPELTRFPIERRIRRAVADNVQIQIEALRLWADQLEQQRDAYVSETLAALTDPEADLSGELPAVRERVLAYRSQVTEPERTAAEQQLRAVLAAGLDRKIAALRRRADQMEAGAADEVDRRVERILAGRGPGPGPREGRRRGGKPRP